MNDAAEKFKQGFAGATVADETADLAKDAVTSSVAAVPAPVADTEVPLASDAQEVAPDVPPEEAMTPEESHKEAAWAGRLRKREEELKAREAALAEKPGGAASDNAAEPMAGEDADLDDPEKASRQLEEDFGADFIRMLRATFRGIIAETLAEIDPKLTSRFAEIESGLSTISNGLHESHYESIEEAHPDYLDIAADPAFSEWIESMPGNESEEAKGVIQRGSARKINKLLTRYKSEGAAGTQEQNQKSSDAIDESAMKAAAGVRSTSFAPSIGDNQSSDPMEAFRRGFRNAGK